jgi:hypothetical protein
MRIFVAGGLSVSVEDIDFMDPGHPEYGRERGVRLELRISAQDTLPGSIYASRGLSIDRAVCRFDLLESGPGAQDRMHWHPRMTDGDPCERVFETDLRADPLAFLGERLRDAVGLLERAGVEDPKRFAGDAATLARMADAIVADAAAGLERLRGDGWPEVSGRDDRGMAIAG